jgi:iron complex transport system permease protein
MGRALSLWTVLALVAVAAFALALATGSGALSAAEVWHALRAGDTHDPAGLVVWQLRLPRAVAAASCGGLLALAGALMQVLLRNPLADPYVLGVSSGAAVGALATLAFGLGALAVQAGAFGGALATIAIVFALARHDLAQVAGRGALDPTPRLLLTGVVLGAGWAALITLMLSLAPEVRLRGMLFWLAGDLAGADGGTLALVTLAAALAAVWPLARSLNVLLRGPVVAAALGVHVVPLRRTVYLVASLATAIAVTTAGGIGFVGLVVPHALRLVIGNDQRVLLPACALGGAALLLVADTVARTVAAPQQIPVGVVTALLGVPTFLLLLARGPRRDRSA